MPALLLFCPLVLTLLSLPIFTLTFSYILVLFSLPVFALLSGSMPTLSSLFVSILLSYPEFGPTRTYLTSSALRKFNQTSSDESLRHRKTSPAEPICLFPTLGLLLEKIECKQIFDIAFIKSHPPAGNHAAKKVDLSFGECRYLILIKLNWLLKLELLDCIQVG